MPNSPMRRRIIACIDGQEYDGHGQQNLGNNSNIFRVWASIKKGTCETADGNKVEQIKKYFHGEKKTLERQILDVCSFCIDNIKGSDDEIWLFGLGYGAWVARSVVSQILTSPVLERSSKSPYSLRRVSGRLSLSWDRNEASSSSDGSNSTHWTVRPRIQFMGFFDMPQNDSRVSTVDICSKGSVRHIRHALALNEKRKDYPESPQVGVEGGEADTHSLVQAWFVGTHHDIGGGAEHDGISLYPSQWMFTESQKLGLILERQSGKLSDGLVDDPMELVFPESSPVTNLQSSVSTDGASNQSHAESSQQAPEWVFRYGNGLTISMRDIRGSHQHRNLQDMPWNKLRKRRKPGQQNEMSKHLIRLRPNSSIFGDEKLDKVFEAAALGRLHGYMSTEPIGVIVHPSVYFLLDTYANLGIRDGLGPLLVNLETYRVKSSLKCISGGKNTQYDPWVLDLFPESSGGHSCRILLCGLPGAGKSALLNKVFGIEMSVVSPCARGELGEHDIEQAFESEYHPGIVLHDSDGFQAGGTKEIEAFRRFLKHRSADANPRDRLHAIWLCIPAPEPRPVQDAMTKILKAVANLCPTIPVIIVCTKKDRLEAEDVAECNESVSADESLLKQRELTLRKLYERDKRTASFWPQLRTEIVFVSTRDPESVNALIKTTMQSLNEAAAFEALCAAQVVNIDIKIDQAIDKTVKFLQEPSKKAYFKSTINSTTKSSRSLCNAIATGCFGLSAAKALEIEKIVSSVVWANMAPFLALVLGPGTLISGTASAASVAAELYTLEPIGHQIIKFTAKVLRKGAARFEVPAIRRMLTKCACDIILVLDQAFRDGGGKSVTSKKIDTVAKIYADVPVNPESAMHLRVSRKRLVHKEVNDLIPLLSSEPSHRHLSNFRKDMKAIIEKYRFKEGAETGFNATPDNIAETALTMAADAASLVIQNVAQVSAEDEIAGGNLAGAGTGQVSLEGLVPEDKVDLDAMAKSVEATGSNDTGGISVDGLVPEDEDAVAGISGNDDTGNASTYDDDSGEEAEEDCMDDGSVSSAGT